MEGKRRQFSREFKGESVRLGIRPEQLREWRGQVKRMKPRVGVASAEAEELQRPAHSLSPDGPFPLCDNRATTNALAGGVFH